MNRCPDKSPRKRRYSFHQSNLERKHDIKQARLLDCIDHCLKIHDYPGDGVIDRSCQIDHPRFGILKQSRHKIAQNCHNHHGNRRENPVAVFLIPCLCGADFRFSIGNAPGNSIKNHRDDRNHDSGKKTLAELRFAQGGQNCPADVVCTAND